MAEFDRANDRGKPIRESYGHPGPHQSPPSSGAILPLLVHYLHMTLALCSCGRGATGRCASCGSLVCVVHTWPGQVPSGDLRGRNVPQQLAWVLPPIVPEFTQPKYEAAIARAEELYRLGNQCNECAFESMRAAMTVADIPGLPADEELLNLVFTADFRALTGQDRVEKERRRITDRLTTDQNFRSTLASLVMRTLVNGNFYRIIHRATELGGAYGQSDTRVDEYSDYFVDRRGNLSEHRVVVGGLRRAFRASLDQETTFQRAWSYRLAGLLWMSYARKEKLQESAGRSNYHI